MRIGLSTACLYGLPLRSFLRMAASCDVDGVELVMCPEVRLRGARGIRRLLCAFGLDVLSVHVALLPPLPVRWPGDGLGVATRVAVDLGADAVVFHAPFSPWASSSTQRWLTSLDGAMGAVKGTRTSLALENVGTYGQDTDGEALSSIPELVAFAERRSISLTLDTCHVGNAAMGLLETYERVRPLLANVHLSDYGPRTDEKRVSSRSLTHSLRSEHRFPGAGDLPLRRFLRQLAADGYTGSINLELSPLALRLWEPRQVGERLGAAVDWVRNAIREGTP